MSGHKGQGAEKGLQRLLQSTRHLTAWPGLLQRQPTAAIGHVVGVDAASSSRLWGRSCRW